ncbi:MAG: hypothetical protein NTV43_12720 [Methylococcales bacterium]|nr:hypothetical protein [Methylococcales bacterium]
MIYALMRSHSLAIMLSGRKGTAMPPWQPFMDKDEALWLVGVLRKGKP